MSRWFSPGELEADQFSDVVSAPGDPEALIARFKQECAGSPRPSQCRELRLQVEAVFLQSLTTARASNMKVDPQWYRVAADSENPQLACIGVTELIWFPRRTPQDDASIARALESPYHAVRGAVWMNANKVPELAGPMSRNGGFNYSELSGVCIDEGRDLVPGLKWAGNYPGAQFRPFASNVSRRWFTTTDPPEKVFAWFASRGKRARTEEQMLADAQARYMEEMTRLSSHPEVDNTQKMMEMIMNQAADSQWSEPFRNMEGIGEVRYVMIGSGQAIAIFRDDVLNATSIVASEPKELVNLMAVDLEAAKEEAEMRSIFGY